jgi:hypothetical protein
VGIIRSVIWQGQDYSGRPFVVTPGQDVSAVVVTTTWQIARLQGTVRDAQGRPATRGAVMCFPVDPAGWRRYGVQPTRLRSVATNTAGTFDIGGLPGGDYYLLAVDESLAAAWRDAAFLESAVVHATRVSLAWGETRAIDLTIARLTR